MRRVHLLAVLATTVFLFHAPAYSQDAGRANAHIPEALQTEHEQALDDLNIRGYMEQTDQLPAVEYIIQKMEDRRIENLQFNDR